MYLITRFIIYPNLTTERIVVRFDNLTNEQINLFISQGYRVEKIS
jgi:hypothetical protein